MLVQVFDFNTFFFFLALDDAVLVWYFLLPTPPTGFTVAPLLYGSQPVVTTIQENANGNKNTIRNRYLLSSFCIKAVKLLEILNHTRVVN